ncbi:MAG: hypothetical protein AB8B99_02460 [Phormidesmis sp.]
MTATQPPSAPRQLQSRQLLGVNQQTYQSLKASISLDLRRQLLIAVCDSVEMQAQIASQLEQDIQGHSQTSPAGLSPHEDTAHPNQSIDRLIFDADDGNLPQQIANWMRHTLFTVGSLPKLQVLGIEQMTRQPAITQNYFLRSLDKIEALLPRLNTSLLVWVPWPWLRTIQQSSPTFWNWRNGVFEFVSDPTPTPASREALDIDLSMFEPERNPHNPQLNTSTLTDINTNGTLNSANNGAGQNGANYAANGHSKGQVIKTAASNGYAHGIIDAPVQDTETNGSKPFTGAASTETAPAETVSPINQAVAGQAVTGQTETNQTETNQTASDQSEPNPSEPDKSDSDKSLPLEFWDDDFPTFNSDIESEAEKLDNQEQLLAADDSNPSNGNAVIDGTATTAEAPTSQAGFDLEQALQGITANEPAQETEEATLTTINALIGGLADAPSPKDIAAPSKKAPTSEPLITETVSAETTAPATDKTAASTAQEQSSAPKRARQQKRGHQRKVMALGGLSSIVSQGVNVPSSVEDVERNPSSNQNTQDEGTQNENTQNEQASLLKEDNPATLLDALSSQKTDLRPVRNDSKKIPVSTEIPILIKKTTVTQSSQVVEAERAATHAASTVQVAEKTQLEIAENAQQAPQAHPEVNREPITSQTVEQLSLSAEEPLNIAEAIDIETIGVAPDVLEAERAIAEAEATAKTNQAQANNAAQFFAEGLAYRNRIEGGERGLTVIEPAIAAYEKGLACLRDPHPDQITGLNDLGTLYWLKAQQQSEKEQAIICMEKSIQLYQQALQKKEAHLLAESRNPSQNKASDFVQTGITEQLHSNMGAVFTMLATCKDPVNYLTQAANSYQQALGIVSLETNPSEYATLQNSLGSVFWKLSHYESVETHLHQAIVAYQEALPGYKAEEQPLDYAAVQNNLGITYWSLAKHEQPERLLKQAITAYRDALNYRTSDIDPAACAISYNNLALAYWDLSKQTHRDLAQKSRYQKNAVTAFEAALNINNLSGALSPMDSAAIYHCLGDVHAQMTESAPSTVEISESLQKSLYSYVKSLENLSTDSPAYPPRFGAIVANLRLHYEKLGLEGQQAALNRVPAALLPQVMMAL